MRSDDSTVSQGPHLQKSGARRIGHNMRLPVGGGLSVIFDRQVAADASRGIIHGGGDYMKFMLFVDDHPIYCDGVRRALEAGIDGLSVLVAGSVEEALGALGADARIDLCLADYLLPDGDGLTLISRIRTAHPTVAVGILCGEPNFTLAEDVRGIGGVACLSKEMDTEGLVAAVAAIFEGDDVFAIGAQTAGAKPLSDRRRRILIYASKGLPDKQISDKLGISESTVRNHWHHIFRQLGVTNRTEAVTQALRRTLI